MDSNKAKYVAIDTETGGLSEDTSLLTVYFAALDENFNLVHPSATLALEVRPGDGVYHVTADALGINKIDLIKHDANAVEAGKAGEMLRAFLATYCGTGKARALPFGQNVKFDLIRIYGQLLSKDVCERWLSYRTLDCGVVGEFLKSVGLIPQSVSGSLSSYADYFEIDTSAAHTADGDVWMSVEIIKKMGELVK